jgi:ATP-dependent Clp protease ATP-binding subunit ClpA
MGMVRAHFRPEFLNRLDEIVLFERLSRAPGERRRGHRRDRKRRAR